MNTEPLPRRTALYHGISEQIRTFIIGEGMQPGDRLPSESEIAGLLGVKRLALREAFRELQLLGVIEIRHGIGAFVRDPKVDAVWSPLGYEMMLNTMELREIFEVRTRLEAAFIHLAAERLTAHQLTQLQSIHESMISKVKEGQQIVDEDAAFHTALFSQVDNAFLKHLLSVLWQAEKQMTQNTAITKQDLAKAVDQHIQILQYLQKRDL